MKTMQICVCEICDKPLLGPNAGFLCFGNIYTAEPTAGTRLMGDDPSDDTKGHSYCIPCFLNALGFEEVQVSGREVKCAVGNKAELLPQYVVEYCLACVEDSKFNQWIKLCESNDVGLALREAKNIVSGPESVILGSKARVVKKPDFLIAEFSSTD